jgi:UDP-N-acetylglucosamine 2-epimerase (non-hydrolysing)
VRAAVTPHLGGLDNVVLTEPVPYPDLVRLLDRCRLVITDSGGLQEEAPALGKPVLVCRDTTERPEAVAAGVAALVGTDTDVIVTRAGALLRDDGAYRAMSQAHNPYGDGHAATRCVTALEELTA